MYSQARRDFDASARGAISAAHHKTNTRPHAYRFFTGDKVALDDSGVTVALQLAECAEHTRMADTQSLLTHNERRRQTPAYQAPTPPL